MKKQLTPFYKSPLFFFHILSHISLIPMIMYGGVFEWSIAIIMYHLFGCIGVAATYHRLVAHKSYEAPAWFKFIGMVLGTLGGVGSGIQWTAVHRAHHRFADTDSDPHNPENRFWTMQFLTMLVPATPRYVPDLMRSKLQQKFHKYYWAIHAAYAITLLLINPFALVYAYLFPCLVLWHVMAALGTFAHTPGLGYAAEKSKDKSQNLWFLGIFGFGEGWHNNHHAEASSYRFGKNPLELDLTARIIDLIRTDR